MMPTYDVIVIGGGTMGSAAAWSLAKRGARALVLEQFSQVHPYGSHSGKTRIIRQVYAESPDYVPLVQRAEVLWHELQAEVGQQLLYRTGGLDLSAPGYRQAHAAREAAIAHGLPHEWLDGAEVRRRWPAWHLGDEWVACYSPQTGFLRAEGSVAALGTAARRRGVEIRENEPVRRWEAHPRGVAVYTDQGSYYAERVVIAAGAWARPVLAGLALPLLVVRKLVWWFAVERPELFAIGNFPIFISEGDLGSVYGFPQFESTGIKIANHSAGQPTSPELVDRAVHASETVEVRPFVENALPGVSSHVVDRAVCLYTLTPDHDFVVDRHPAMPNVVVAAGFSGHGFKFATALGEHLVDLLFDPATNPYPRFALERFSPDHHRS